MPPERSPGSAAPLHPALRGQALGLRIARWLLTLASLLLAALAILPVPLALTFEFWPLLALTPLALTGLWFTGRLLPAEIQRRLRLLEAASRLLETRIARPVRFHFERIVGWDGPLARVEEPDGRRYAVLLSAGQLELPSPGDWPAELWDCDPASCGTADPAPHPLVLRPQSRRQLLVATRLTRNQAAAQLRRLERLLVWVVVPLIPWFKRRAREFLDRLE